MIRYTTPTLILRVPVKLEDVEIYVSLRQKEICINRAVADGDVSIEDGKTIIKVYYTQKETAKLRKNVPAEVQVNWVYQDGSRNATRMKEVLVTDNLFNKEVDYAG